MGKSPDGSWKLKNTGSLFILSIDQEIADCLIHSLGLNKEQRSIEWIGDPQRAAFLEKCCCWCRRGW